MQCQVAQELPGEGYHSQFCQSTFVLHTCTNFSLKGKGVIQNCLMACHSSLRYFDLFCNCTDNVVGRV